MPSAVKTCRLISLLLLAVIQTGFSAEPPGGQVVWWGRNAGYYSPTNGLVREDGESMTNAVAIAAGHGQALIRRSDGSVFPFSFFNTPADLSDIVSIAHRDFYSAIDRYRTVIDPQTGVPK